MNFAVAFCLCTHHSCKSPLRTFHHKQCIFTSLHECKLVSMRAFVKWSEKELNELRAVYAQREIFLFLFSAEKHKMKFVAYVIFCVHLAVLSSCDSSLALLYLNFNGLVLSTHSYNSTTLHAVNVTVPVKESFWTPTVNIFFTHLMVRCGVSNCSAKQVNNQIVFYR